MNTDEEARVKRLTRLGDGLWELRRSGSSCDVTVVANDVAFQCHKAVLCAMSPYFNAMFTHDMKESRDSTVTMHEVKAEIFELILECIYRGVDIVNDYNVKDVMKIASLLQISSIFEQCESQLSKTLSVSNFIDIWFIAKKYSCDKLEGIVWTFMLENFSMLCGSDNLAQLPLDTFTALLRDDNLNAKGEVVVCKAAIKWLSTDLENRKLQGPDLLKSLRIPICPSEYILRNLMYNDVFNAIQGSQEILQEALMFHMCPAKKSTFSTMQMSHRAASMQNDMLVIIGGSDTSNNSSIDVRCYSFLGRTWYQLPSLPENVGMAYAACTFGDDIYVSGGHSKQQKFYKFQASTCTWISLPDMLTGRCLHAMTAIDDTIYTLGGQHVTIIEGYQVNDAVWEKYGELLFPVLFAMAAVYEQTILVFGEYSRVQIFDTTTNQVTKIDAMFPQGLGQYAACIANGNVNYVIGSDGQVFETSEKNASVVGKIEYLQTPFRVTQYRGCFYVVSGIQPDVSNVQVVNPVTLNINETISIPPNTEGLPWLWNRCNLHCCRIVISKRILQGKEIHVSEPQK